MAIASGFIGRDKEQVVLKRAIDEHIGGICIYGPRRVGKTALIQKVLSGMPPSSAIYFECVKGSYLYNLELFASEVSRVLGSRYIRSMRDIFDIFDAIVRESRDRHVVVVIDEYPYMRDSLADGVLDSYIQRLIDTLSGKVSIVLSGSFISVMKEMLEEGSPLFGRFGRVLELKPFSYLDAALFYPSLSVRDKIAFYSVFGGYPFALRALDEGKSLYENIADNLLDGGSVVANTIENVLFTEAGRSGVPTQLLYRIGNGRLRYSEIENAMCDDVSGTLDRSIKRLIGMGIIEKISPINRKDDRKKTFYEIKDNLLRFFFTYIMPHKAMIVRTAPEEFLSAMVFPSLDTFISKRFEGIVREYFTFTAGLSALDIGTYWYDDRKSHTNGEFDCVLKLPDQSYQVYEVKYLKNRMTEDLYLTEKDKMMKIPSLDISSYGFVSSSGFAFNTKDKADRFISGDELYSI